MVNRISENSNDNKSDILSDRSGLFLFGFCIVYDLLIKGDVLINCEEDVDEVLMYVILIM